jgi:hypothetical protein
MVISHNITNYYETTLKHSIFIKKPLQQNNF